MSKYFENAINAFMGLRKKTESYVGSPERKPLGLWGKYRFFYLIFFYFFCWLINHYFRRLHNKYNYITLYSPSRTPMKPKENASQFLNRVGRSNRCDKNLQDFFPTKEKNMLCVRVDPGISFSKGVGESVNLVNYILSHIGFVGWLKILYGFFYVDVSFKKYVLSEMMSKISNNFSLSRSTLILLTSNSTLVEILRLSVIVNENNEVVEVLHGIASMGTFDYFNFIEKHARCKLVYINLIKDLPRFPSIENYLMKDEKGEVAINCQLWSTVPFKRKIYFDKDLIDSRPILIVGGGANANNYFKCHFFQDEVEVIEKTRKIFPEKKILYARHPANARNDPFLMEVCDKYNVSISNISTIHLSIVSQVVIGTYSTSVFEAAMLNKSILLMPFDYSMIWEGVYEKENIRLCRSKEEIESNLMEVKEELRQKKEDIAYVQSMAHEYLGVSVQIK